jgi:hypothetical protein
MTKFDKKKSSSYTQKKLFRNSSAADDIHLRKMIWKRIFPLHDTIFSSL